MLFFSKTLSPTSQSFQSLPEVAEAVEAVLTVDQIGTISENLKFDHTLLNTNFVYDVNTGTFHCRQRGIYLFSITLYINSPDKAVPVNMFLNNLVIARPSTGASNAIVTASETAVASAREGDELRIKFTYSQSPTTVLKNSRFSAVLIQKLP